MKSSEDRSSLSFSIILIALGLFFFIVIWTQELEKTDLQMKREIEKLNVNISEMEKKLGVVNDR